MKTTWKTLIKAVNDMDGDYYETTSGATHYFGFEKWVITKTYKNKWLALLMVKGRAILLDTLVDGDYGIYFDITPKRD